MDSLALLIIFCGAVSLLFLAALHFLSPEYQPSWRMVSEYGMGKYKWMLAAFFLLWGACSILSSCLIWNIVSTGWARLGAVLVFITGVGAILGGLFDVKHKLHGLAFGLGVPFLPIAALLTSYQILKIEGWGNFQTSILLSAHSIWISLVLMGGSMALLFAGFKKLGIPFGPNIDPPNELPHGVMGINGYMNRLLIICYIAWPVVIAKVYLSL